MSRSIKHSDFAKIIFILLLFDEELLFFMSEKKDFPLRLCELDFRNVTFVT